MAAGITLYQGETKLIIVETNEDLSSAVEIEFRVDTNPQIIKTLTGSGIANVTTTQFEVTIEPEDTESVPAGPYKYQMRSTDNSGNITNGKFSPNKMQIKPSIFVTQGQGNDYN